MDRYRKILEEECEKNRALNGRNAAQQLDDLTKMLHKATELVVPYKLIKLKGPTWRASPTVKKLLVVCKQKHKLWINGRKSDDLRKDCVIAKRALRKQLRQEKYNDRKHFYNELMQNPSTEKFYQLIRKNRDSNRQKTSSIIVDGKEIFSPEKQRKAFADYYEDLSVPKATDMIQHT